MRIEVLGPVTLRGDDGDVVDVPERKVRALLVCLAAASGETVAADALIDRIWGEELPANPRRVLQAKLSQLRALLDSASAGGREALVRSAGGYSLSVSAETFDAAAFRRSVREAAGLPADQNRVRLLRGALQSWRGPAYGEFRDELWLASDVAELMEVRLQAVELCVEALTAVGEAQEAVSLGAPYIAEHPARERLVAALMQAYYRSRRQPDALAAYERLRSHLAEEYGIDPASDVRDLHTKILRQDPGLDELVDQAREPDAETAQPPTAELDSSAPVGASRLPAYASPFLGRTDEVKAVHDLLIHHRLVTLLGIGGIGKTRLAVRAAETVVDHCRSDAWFVDLAEIPGRSSEGMQEPGDRVARVVASALNLSTPRQGTGDLTARIAAALENRDALLVFDNCEHVIDEASTLASQLLVRVPRLRILATSREPMALPEEQRYVVPHLPVNGGTSPAVEFFYSRARTVNPELTADRVSLEAASELCRRLDGLPLALELAAARTNVLSVAELLDRITDRLDLLSRPGRAAPRRQQTLRGMLDWSWSLLDDQERILLRRLSVHPVTWKLDVMETICADSPPDPSLMREPAAEESAAVGPRRVLPRGRILPTLARLVERSLVSTVNVDGEVRYRLLETVGTYAFEKLAESGEREAVALRHLSYFRNFVECAREYLFGPRARDWVRSLGDVRPHLSHALNEALHSGDGDAAVALVLNTFWYRWMTGHIDSLVEELPAVVACAGCGEMPADRHAYAQVAVLAAVLEDQQMEGRVERVEASLGRFSDDESGQLAKMQVQWFAATCLLADEEHRKLGERLADESIQHLLRAGEIAAAAFASTQRDWFLLEYWGAAPKGLPDGHNPERILRDHGDAYGLTQVLAVQHLLAEAEGRTELALELTNQAADLSAGLGLNGEAAYWRSVQAVNALRKGDLATAESHLERARELTQSTAFVFATASIEAMEAVVAHTRGEQERAAQILNELSAEDRAVARRGLARFLGEESLPAGLQLNRS